MPSAPGPQIFEGDELDVDLALESLNPAGDERAPADVEDELARLVAAPPSAPPPSTPPKEPSQPLPAAAPPAPQTGRVVDRRLPPASARGPVAPAGRLQQTRTIPLWLVGGGGLVFLLSIGAVAYTVWPRRPAPSSDTAASLPTVVIPQADPPATTIPRNAATLPADPPQTAPEASAPAVDGPARLEIDFEHSLKSGELRVWIDGELVLEEELDSRVTKKILAYRKRKGSVEGALQVGPGEHTIAIEVRWDDNIKRKRISATFEGGTTRRLRASLGGLLRKELSVEWE